MNPVSGNYVLPMFMPTGGQGYRWVGFVFAQLEPEFNDELPADPAELRERGFVEAEAGVYLGMQFNLLEQESAMSRLRETAPPQLVVQALSMN